MKRFTAGCVCAGLMLGFAVPSVAQTVWDEDVNGDLSGDRLNPTPIPLAVGTSSLYAYSGESGPETYDREYFTITLAPGTVLSEMILVDYFGDDGAAFAGVQAGPILSVDPDNATPGDLLGYSLFGTSIETLGTNYLPRIGTGPGSIGFTPPLTAGEYTFWMQQLGPICNYQWDFVVTPEPTSAALLLLAGALAFRRGR